MSFVKNIFPLNFVFCISVIMGKHGFVFFKGLGILKFFFGLCEMLGREFQILVQVVIEHLASS